MVHWTVRVLRVKLLSIYIPLRDFSLEEEVMKKFLSVAMALCLAASLVACGGAGGTDGDADPTAIKIGGIGPITGSAAQYGEAVKNGIQLAVDEINAKGGIQFAYQFEYNPFVII